MTFTCESFELRGYILRVQLNAILYYTTTKLAVVNYKFVEPYSFKYVFGVTDL